jgi:hypothetical protein
MNSKHLTDDEIQLYVFNSKDMTKNIIEHINACGKCKAEADFYRLLSAEIKRQEKPAFKSDLTQNIMLNLIYMEPAPSKSDNFSWINPVIIILFSVVIAGFIYGRFLSSMFKNIPDNALYLILTTASAFLLFQGIELFMKYKKLMEMLNIKRVQQ